MLLTLLHFSACTVASLKHKMSRVDWQSAAPELQLEQPPLSNSTRRASASATVVAQMALCDENLLPVQEESVQAKVPSCSPQDLGSTLADRDNAAPSGRSVHQPRGVRPQRHLPVRGNVTGRYPRRRRCMTRWVWRTADQKWQPCPFKGSALPLPSWDMWRRLQQCPAGGLRFRQRRPRRDLPRPSRSMTDGLYRRSL